MIWVWSWSITMNCCYCWCSVSMIKSFSFSSLNRERKDVTLQNNLNLKFLGAITNENKKEHPECRGKTIAALSFFFICACYFCHCSHPFIEFCWTIFILFEIAVHLNGLNWGVKQLWTLFNDYFDFFFAPKKNILCNVML